MPAPIEDESTLADLYQATLPEVGRCSLRLGKRDMVHYSISPYGEVVLSREEALETNELVPGQFFDFLSRDIAEHPERLQDINDSLVQRLQSLSMGIELDLSAPLSADDAWAESHTAGYQRLDSFCSTVVHFPS